eukprot:CAMPEP_0184451214 /NCGR_PEP_ID=MMETSP0740-20130409/6278_1 /TAXON_ID=385413 /ORGANISM="Thalassiosira miniscula, Strain CCMP1093" /LENGTH=69 /DNA_ID=CAMNT_0026821655 /DNA_START=323 /DNA_END=532 /DNA_ORIENTATION=-
MTIMINARPTVASVCNAAAYRIVAVVAAANGKTYAQYSPNTDGLRHRIGPSPNNSSNSTNTHPSNISPL